MIERLPYTYRLCLALTSASSIVACAAGQTGPSGPESPSVPSAAVTLAADSPKIVYRFRAFRRHFQQVDHASPDLKYALVRRGDDFEIHDTDGYLVQQNAHPGGCTRARLVRGKYFTVCDNHVLFYETETGRILDRVDYPIDVIPGRFPVFDDDGFTYQIRGADGRYHHFNLRGDDLGSSKEFTYRHGDDWGHFYWFTEDSVVRVDDGDEAVFELPAGRFSHSRRDGLVTDHSSDAPNDKVFDIARGEWVAKTRPGGFSRGARFQAQWRSPDELEANSLHGYVETVRVDPADDSVLIASDDGLLKRWDLVSGEGELLDVPREYAAGGFELGPGGCLVFRRVYEGQGRSGSTLRGSSAYRKNFSHPDISDGILVQCPDGFTKELTFDTSGVYQAVMPDRHTVAWVGADELVWYDLNEDEVRKRRPGHGVFARDGSFYTHAPKPKDLDEAVDVYGADHQRRFTLPEGITSCIGTEIGTESSTALACGPPDRDTIAWFDARTGESKPLDTGDSDPRRTNDDGTYVLANRVSYVGKAYRKVLDADGNVVRSSGGDAVAFIGFAPGGYLMVRGIEDFRMEKLP